MSTDEAVLLDDVPRTLAHVENDISRDGLVDADAGAKLVARPLAAKPSVPSGRLKSRCA
jgi:hypothetical protein